MCLWAILTYSLQCDSEFMTGQFEDRILKKLTNTAFKYMSTGEKPGLEKQTLDYSFQNCAKLKSREQLHEANTAMVQKPNMIQRN